MTKILGFRADPTNARYAIVSYDGASFILENAASESRLIYPADMTDASKKILWLYREIDRIFHADSSIERVVIKTNEFGGMPSTAPMRVSGYLEASVMLFCEQRQIPVCLKTYASLSTRSAEVKTDAEQRVGRTAKHWDNKIADAVVAAWWGAQQT